jgi:hypothetical protein
MLSRLGTGRAQVRQVRAELDAQHRLHGRYVTDVQVQRLMFRTGDAGLAADAISMWPRPGWVEAICGPYPPTLELANPEDVASVAEFGPADVDGQAG